MVLGQKHGTNYLPYTFKQEVISDYLLENSQIQEHLGHIPKNYLLSQQFLKILLQSPITQS